MELTYKLFNLMMETFPPKELKVIDCTLRMFIEPSLSLDLPLLEQHLEDVKNKIYIIERSPFTDANCFGKLCYENGNMNKMESSSNINNTSKNSSSKS